MQSPFREILKHAVHATRGATGCALAADDGETVDSWSSETWAEDDWALLTAHCGVVFQHVYHSLRTFHFGDVDSVLICFKELSILMQAVDDGYFALLAINAPGECNSAETNLHSAVLDLRREMA